MRGSLRTTWLPRATVLALTALCLVSCASMSTRKATAAFPLAGEGSSFGADGLSAFVRENLATFSTFKLSNGLPVIVKKNTANRVQHISLVIRGGSAAAEPESAGYEALALRVMTMESAGYSYQEIQSLLAETSSALGSSSVFDYSTYGLTTLDKYFTRLFPIWVDAIVHPSFGQADFDQALSQAKLALQAKEQDPWEKTGLAMNEIFFAGHPYASSPDGTKESLEAMSLGDAVAWYKARINAAEIFVVAVGNFDPRSLRAQLEAGLGKLPSSGPALPPTPPAFERTGKGSLAKVEFPASKGMGYLRGDFAAPPPSDPDFLPLNLGMRVLSDLLFDIVRDKHGAVYSVAARIRALDPNYGSITLFKTKQPGPAKAYVDQAVALLAEGKAVAIDPEKSTDGYEPLAEVLDAVKAQYIDELYSKMATNSAIAASIVQSVVTRGDYRDYLLDEDRINAVTPAQVASAVDRYLLKGTISWVALGSADVLASAQEGEFESFSSTK